MSTGKCPECGADVEIKEDADEGDILNCSNCGTHLEIVSLDPVDFDVVEDEDPDEYDDDE